MAIYLVIAMIAIQSAPVSTTQSLDRPYLLENRDDHPVAQKLVDYLEESNQVIDVAIDMVEDSLFPPGDSRNRCYSLKGFSEELLAGAQPQMVLKTNGDLKW